MREAWVRGFPGFPDVVAPMEWRRDDLSSRLMRLEASLDSRLQERISFVDTLRVTSVPAGAVGSHGSPYRLLALPCHGVHYSKNPRQAGVLATIGVANTQATIERR